MREPTNRVTRSWTDTVAVLLPTLSERMPDWTVLKNHERLPEVTGDIDLCLDRSRRDAFTRELVDLLRSEGDFSVVWCDHFPDLRLVFVIDNDLPAGQGSALELDLADGVWWKGRRLMAASEVVRRATKDPRGFRCASPGTEAAFHLTVESLSRWGRLRTTARHFPRIKELAERDEEAFVDAMHRMHGAIGRRVARRFLGGAWSPLDGWLVVVRRIARGPAGFLRRGTSWLRRRRMGHWRGLPRTMPHGAEEWLARVGPGHRVVPTRPGDGEASP